MISLYLIIVLFAAFIVSAILTGLIRKYALKREMIDHPNERSSHEVPTPRGGGAAIVLVVLVGLFFLPETFHTPSILLYAVLGGGLLVGGIGFWDDHRHIPARWRVLVQLIAAAWSIFWIFGLSPQSDELLTIILNCAFRLALILFIVYMINTYNFMDGIDGIAAVEAITTGTIGGILLYNYFDKGEPLIAVLWLVAAGALGFLFWNWPPAKVFMGDSGSGFLGYIFGFFIVIYIGFLWVWNGESSISIPLVLPILLGVFIVDSTITLLRRILRGEHFWLAHRMHAYQHASRRWGHKKVTIAVGLINILFLAPCAWIACAWPQHGIWTMLFSWLVLAVAAVALSAGKPEEPDSVGG